MEKKRKLNEQSSDELKKVIRSFRKSILKNFKNIDKENLVLQNENKLIRHIVVACISTMLDQQKEDDHLSIVMPEGTTIGNCSMFVADLWHCGVDCAIKYTKTDVTYILCEQSMNVDLPVYSMGFARKKNEILSIKK